MHGAIQSRHWILERVAKLAHHQRSVHSISLSLRALRPVITDPRHTITLTHTSTMFSERENTDERKEFNRETAGEGNESFH